MSAAARVGSTGRKLARLTGRDNAGNTTTVSCRYRVLGHIESLMGWNYDPHAAYTVMTSLVASKVPSGSTIRVASRRLKVHARVRISIAEPNMFGETWILEIRGGRAPTSQRACLSPGSFTRQSGDR